MKLKDIISALDVNFYEESTHENVEPKSRLDELIEKSATQMLYLFLNKSETNGEYSDNDSSPFPRLPKSDEKVKKNLPYNSPPTSLIQKDDQKPFFSEWQRMRGTVIPITKKEQKQQFEQDSFEIEQEQKSKEEILTNRTYEGNYKILRNKELSLEVENFMNGQIYIKPNMFPVLANWINEVNTKVNIKPEIFYLAMYIIAKYLYKVKDTKKDKFQLLGITSLFIASKIEGGYLEINDVVSFCDRAYTKKEILDMEMKISVELNFDFIFPTVYNFMARFIAASHSDRTMVIITSYASETAMVDSSMYNYLPSMIAATSVLISRIKTGRDSWNRRMRYYTGYEKEDLAECKRDLERVIENNKESEVHEKYSLNKFGNVAKLYFEK